MKSKVRLFALLASLFAIGACENLPELPQNGVNDFSDIPLNINAVPAGDFTRATDTAFETGDAISVFGYKGDLSSGFNVQTWLTNGKFTKGANGFTSAETHYWYSGEEMGHIIGLYPYSDSYTAEEFLANGVSFYVKSDQSTHAGYTASDLMYAVANNVTPTANEVVLEFNHVLSKLVVDIDNQSSASIKDVYVSGVFGGASYSMLGGYTIGDSGSIKAGKLANASQGYTDSYTLIIPPQQEIPNIAIITTTNKQYTFSVNEPIEFNSGKERHLKVTITEDNVSTEIDATIRDWSADEDVEFSDSNNPGDNTPEYMKMEVNPNWDFSVIENFYYEANDVTYPAVMQMNATDTMAHTFAIYYKEFWESLTEEERLLVLYEFSVEKSNILVETIASYKNELGQDVTAEELYYSGSSLRALNLNNGEYIACVIGFNSDGTVAYKYACSNYFTFTNIISEEYLAWCGTWEISDGTNSNIVEITVKEAGRTYWLEGWEGVSGVRMELEFDPAEKCIKFYGQTVAEEIYLEDGTFISQILLVGRTNYGSLYQNVYAVDGYMQDENSAIVESKMYSSAEDPEYFTNLYYVMVIDGQTYYATDPDLAVSFPATMTRVTTPETSQAAAHNTPMIEELPAPKAITPAGIGFWGELHF